LVEPDWQRDGITLYCGDCLDVLPTLAAGSVDAVVTDAPYANGTAYASYQDTPAELARLIAAIMRFMLRTGSRVAVTPGVISMHLWPTPTWALSWHSPNSNARSCWGFSCWQPILVYGKDPYLANRMGCRPDSFTYSSLKKRSVDGHPCPKPLGIMEWIVKRCSLAGEAVLDPLMGSGTTGVACVQTGRRFIGIEKEPKYFEIAVKRIEAAIAERAEQLQFTEAS